MHNDADYPKGPSTCAEPATKNAKRQIAERHQCGVIKPGLFDQVSAANDQSDPRDKTIPKRGQNSGNCKNDAHYQISPPNYIINAATIRPK